MVYQVLFCKLKGCIIFSIFEKNSRPNKQIIVPYAYLLLWTPKTLSRWYNSGVKEILAENSSVLIYFVSKHDKFALLNKKMPKNLY